MTNYAKITLGCVVSEDDEYQPADERWGIEEATSTPASSIKGSGLAPTTPAVFTLPLSVYTEIEAFMIKNTGDTSTMEVYPDIDGTGVTKIPVKKGQMILLTKIDVGTDITIKCPTLTTTFKFMLLVKT